MRRNPETRHLERVPQSGETLIIVYREGHSGQGQAQFVADLGAVALYKIPWRQDLFVVPWCYISGFKEPPQGTVATRWGH